LFVGFRRLTAADVDQRVAQATAFVGATRCGRDSGRSGDGVEELIIVG
jgi:hypothetical protein